MFTESNVKLPGCKIAGEKDLPDLKVKHSSFILGIGAERCVYKREYPKVQKMLASRMKQKCNG